MSVAKRRAIVRMSEGGAPVRDIATTLGISRSTVTKYRVRYGIAVRAVSAVDKSRIVHLAQEGWSNEAIAKAVGWSESTVSRWRTRLGVGARELRTSGSIRGGPELAASIRRLSGEGLPVAEIAARVGWSETTVRRLRRDLRLSTPTPVITQAMEAEMGRLLDDGLSYLEVARTVGCGPATVARRFPGRGWTHSQSARHKMLLGRWKGRFPWLDD